MIFICFFFSEFYADFVHAEAIEASHKLKSAEHIIDSYGVKQFVFDRNQKVLAQNKKVSDKNQKVLAQNKKVPDKNQMVSVQNQKVSAQNKKVLDRNKMVSD